MNAMSNNDWSNIKRIFQEAVELDPAARAGFVSEACGDDSALRSEIESLLGSYESAESFLETPLIHVPGALEEFNELLTSGQKIGNYVLIRRLGYGGMGTVYLAERDDVCQQVAIKVLPRLLLSPARRKRFVSEERALARLRHEYIAQLYDAGVLEDGTPWFAMEYVDGVAITGYCKERPIDECLKLFRMVCEAVLYAHSQLTVHRDLKPSNILVRATERGATPKLLDFGIAKQLDIAADAGDSGLTEKLMTVTYAAPEQLEGIANFKSDVYSLGVTLYELIVGHPPFDFENQSPTAIAVVKTNSDPGKPSAVAKQNSWTRAREPRAGSWADIDMLCLTAMHKDPEQRYASVEALIRDLDHYLASEPLEARGDSIVYRVRKFTQRHRVGVAVAAAILTLGIAWGIFYTMRITTARNQALAAAARTQRVQDFLSELLSGGDHEAGPAADLKVTTVIEQGVRQAQQFDREPEIQAELYYTLGNSYRHLGLFERAEPLLVSSLERRRALFSADHPQVIESLVSVGLLRMEQNKLDDAEKLIREGLEITQRAHPDDAKLYATVVTALGRVLTTRGDYKQAISVVEDAVRRNDTGVPTAELVKLLTQLANANFYAGNYETSENLNRRILVMSRELFGNNHTFVADALINLAAIQNRWGRHKEAEELNRQALSISESWYGKDHPELASNLIHLAQDLTQLGRYEEAEKLLMRALEINKRAYPQGHARTAFALNELGSLAFNRDKLDDAEKWFLEAAEINRKTYGDKHFRTITAMSNLASVYSGKKDYARAVRTMRDVVAGFAAISADHFNVGTSRIKLGRALFRDKQYQEAETEALAGLEILMKQKNPNAPWVRDACQLLIDIYEARREGTKAVKFRELLAQYAGGS